MKEIPDTMNNQMETYRSLLDAPVNVTGPLMISSSWLSENYSIMSEKAVLEKSFISIFNDAISPVSGATSTGGAGGTGSMNVIEFIPDDLIYAVHRLLFLHQSKIGDYLANNRLVMTKFVC